jgi:hypothetical protein
MLRCINPRWPAERCRGLTDQVNLAVKVSEQSQLYILETPRSKARFADVIVEYLIQLPDCQIIRYEAA